MNRPSMIRLIRPLKMIKVRGARLQLLRRAVQGAVVVLIASLALLSLYAHYRAARAVDDPQLIAGLTGEVACRAIHPLVEKLDDPQAFLDANKGSVWSMRLGGVSITDPLAAAEALAATKRVHTPLLISVLVPVILTLLLGKVFCSWICPGYVLFEVAGKLRKVLGLADIRVGSVRFSHANKYIFLLAGLLLAALVSAPFFALIYPPALVSRVIHAWIFGTELAGMVILLAVIVAVEVFVSPRWWCRTICPGGALYGLLGWARPLRVELARNACTGCQDCVPVCEAGINPITQSSTIECDNCGVCIRHCEPAALRFTLAPPRLPGRKRRGSQRMRPSLGKGGAMSYFVALLMVLLFAKPAHGHHILGLPHYSYKENYPQRPTLEYPATTGPYDVLFTSYPGVPIPGEPANLAFYIKNGSTGAVYVQTVKLRVLETSTFGANSVVLPETDVPCFDNEHKVQCVFPLDAEYIVELSLEVEGRVEVIPFLVVAGSPTALTSVALAVAAIGVCGFILVRILQRRGRGPQQEAARPKEKKARSAREPGTHLAEGSRSRPCRACVDGEPSTSGISTP